MCVVSSLAQLMMDPHFRSISGFQALVQKEWVAMGHPFTTRHRLVSRPPSLSPEGTSDEPPVEVCVADKTITCMHTHTHVPVLKAGHPGCLLVSSQGWAPRVSVSQFSRLGTQGVC